MSRYELIHAALTAIIAAITTLTVSGWSKSNRSRELDIKMVELAVQILREENDKDGKLIAAKGWAVDIINAHSPKVKISDAAKSELVARPLAASPFSTHQKNFYEQSDGEGKWIVISPDEFFKRYNRSEPKTPVLKPEDLPEQQ